MNWKTAVLGTHQTSIPEGERQRFGIMETFPHCQFDHAPFDNDIMLLKVLF